MITNQSRNDELKRLSQIYNHTASIKPQQPKVAGTQYGAKGINQSETASAFGTSNNRYGLSQPTQPKPKRFQSRYINNDGKWTYDAVNDGLVGFNDYISDIKDDYKGISFNDKLVQVGQFGNDLKPKPKPIKTKNLYNYKLNGRITHDVIATSDNLAFKLFYYGGKYAQRAIWRKGAQDYLRKRDFLTSAWMLEHSLQDNPSDITRNGDSRIAEMINSSPQYRKALMDKIAESKNGRIDDVIGVSFEGDTDLYFSLHDADIHVKGYRDFTGSWNIEATFSDIYNFTEITTYMGDKWNEFSKSAGLGTIANDAAVFSQLWGAINPYRVTVNFQTKVSYI